MSKAQNSKSNQSEDETPVEETPEVDVPVSDEDAVEENPTKTVVAEDVANVEADAYDPHHDAVVPDSALAEVIVAELAGGDKSPTLEALRDAAKAAEK